MNGPFWPSDFSNGSTSEYKYFIWLDIIKYKFIWTEFIFIYWLSLKIFPFKERRIWGKCILLNTIFFNHILIY